MANTNLEIGFSLLGASMIFSFFLALSVPNAPSPIFFTSTSPTNPAQSCLLGFCVPNIIGFILSSLLSIGGIMFYGFLAATDPAISGPFTVIFLVLGSLEVFGLFILSVNLLKPTGPGN